MVEESPKGEPSLFYRWVIIINKNLNLVQKLLRN